MLNTVALELLKNMRCCLCLFQVVLWTIDAFEPWVLCRELSYWWSLFYQERTRKATLLKRLATFAWWKTSLCTILQGGLDITTQVIWPSCVILHTDTRLDAHTYEFSEARPIECQHYCLRSHKSHCANKLMLYNEQPKYEVQHLVAHQSTEGLVW